MQHGTPNSRFHVSKCADSPGDTPLLNPDSEFPSFRPPSVGPQRDPKIQIPCFQVCRFQDTPLQIPDSEFPSFQDSKGPSVGPRSRGGTPISKFLVSSWADSRILLRKFQIPRFRVCRFLEHTPGQIPDSEFPSFRGPLLGPVWRDTNSRFRVSEFPRPPLGSEPKGPPNSRFRVSEFPRPPLRTSSVRGTPIFQIPSFRVSEASSCRVQARSKPLSKPKGPPNSRFRVSEFPGGPLGSDPEGAQMPDSEIPSFRAAPRAHLARRV